MMTSFADLWFDRGEKADWKIDVTGYFSEYKEEELQADDILLEAADFHCFPRMPVDLQSFIFKEKRKLLSTEVIRKTIWTFRFDVTLALVAQSCTQVGAVYQTLCMQSSRPYDSVRFPLAVGGGEGVPEEV